MVSADRPPMTMSAAEPRLSIVIGTTAPWPGIRGCMDALYDQARRVGAEIIVVDSTTGALPGDERYAGVRLIRAPGKNVFQLRAIGMRAAAGAIVATTED